LAGNGFPKAERAFSQSLVIESSADAVANVVQLTAKHAIITEKILKIIFFVISCSFPLYNKFWVYIKLYIPHYNNTLLAFVNTFFNFFGGMDAADPIIFKFMAHNVPAVGDVFAARIRALRSKDQGCKNVGGAWRGNGA
jgi:hypothetical protein